VGAELPSLIPQFYFLCASPRLRAHCGSHEAVMRLRELPSTLLCLITALSRYSRIASAAPLTSEDLLPSLEDNQDLEKRCTPCGYYQNLCCASNEYCYTDQNDEAQCGLYGVTTNAGVAITSTMYVASNIQYSVYTTTYTQTDLKTVTATLSYPISTQAVVVSTILSCQMSYGEKPCGTCCCSASQTCNGSGQCINTGASSGSVIGPLRGTTITSTTVTATGSATTTVPYQTPTPTLGLVTGAQATTQGHGLSGGAIAGIVIGVIIGIILLFLLCACLCVKSLWDGLLDLFGRRQKRTRTTEETYIEERRSRRGGRTWFGAGPGRGSRSDVVVVEKDRRRSGWGGIAGVTAGLGALALLLGWKRDRDKKRRQEEKSDASYSYGSYSDYTSSSKSDDAVLSDMNANKPTGSESSRETRRTRSRSRVSRVSRR
jgi:hypothetical protein